MSRSATICALDWSAFLLFGFGAVLVVGLLGERQTDEKHTDRQKIWYKRFELFVIIGVAGELIADGGLFVFSQQLESIDGHQIAALYAQLAWRSLSAQQLTELSSAMRPFKGQRIDLVSYLGDAEAQAFADEIISVLKPIGIDAGSFKVIELARLMYGARVETGSTTALLVPGPFPNSHSVARLALTPEAEHAATALDTTLREQGFVTESSVTMAPREIEQGTFKPLTEAPVRLMIGVKPRPMEK